MLALSMSRASRSKASCLLRSWVRKRFASMTNSPSAVIRLPASRINRSLTASLKERELRTANRS